MVQHFIAYPEHSCDASERTPLEVTELFGKYPYENFADYPKIISVCFVCVIHVRSGDLCVQLRLNC